jgi:hypothetical protein
MVKQLGKIHQDVVLLLWPLSGALGSGTMSHLAPWETDDKATPKNQSGYNRCIS